jgi:hypothetical protein
MLTDSYIQMLDGRSPAPASATPWKQGVAETLGLDNGPALVGRCAR